MYGANRCLVLAGFPADTWAFPLTSPGPGMGFGNSPTVSTSWAAPLLHTGSSHMGSAVYSVMRKEIKQRFDKKLRLLFLDEMTAICRDH